MRTKTRQHELFIVRQRPHPYPMTSQQKKFRQVLQECGIAKGISRDELIEKMINCIPQAWNKLKGAS